MAREAPAERPGEPCSSDAEAENGMVACGGWRVPAPGGSTDANWSTLEPARATDTQGSQLLWTSSWQRSARRGLRRRSWCFRRSDGEGYWSEVAARHRSRQRGSSERQRSSKSRSRGPVAEARGVRKVDHEGLQQHGAAALLVMLSSIRRPRGVGLQERNPRPSTGTRASRARWLQRSQTHEAKDRAIRDLCQADPKKRIQVDIAEIGGGT